MEEEPEEIEERAEETEEDESIGEVQIINPHDRFVKAAMENRDVAMEFLDIYVPDEVKVICKLEEFQHIKQSFVDSDLREHITDILFRVPHKDPKEPPLFLYFLMEHLRNNDKLSAFRDWNYKVKIVRFSMEDTGRQEVPLILSFFIYNGKSEFTAVNKIVDLIAVKNKDLARKMIEGFEPIDLQKISHETLMNRLWFPVLAIALSEVDNPDVVARVHKIAYYLREIERTGRGHELLEALLTYMLQTSRAEHQEALVQAVRTSISKQSGDRTLTIADMLVKRGRKEGREQGRKEIALRLLARGFTPEEVSEISGLSLDEVNALG